MLLLQAQNINKLFGAEVLFTNLNMQIEEHAKIGLVGKNGAGKSTFLKIIAGIETASSGEIVTKKNLKMSYLDQNAALSSERTIFQEMLSVFEDLINEEIELTRMTEQISELTGEVLKQKLAEYDRRSLAFANNNGYTYQAEIKTILNGFSFPEAMYDKKINQLSGGQQTRLALAKTLLAKPELLILDEPTNHLDIQTLNWLENYLKSYPQALLIVSHDRYFLDKTTNLTYEISQQKMTRYVGNYSQFLKIKAQNFQTELKAYDKQQKEIAKLSEFVDKNITRASTTKRAQSKRKQLEKMEVLTTPTLDTQSIHFSFQINHPSGNEVLLLDDLFVGYEARPVAEHISFILRRKERLAIVGENGIGKSTLLRTIIGEVPKISGVIKLGSGVSVGYYDQTQERLSQNKTVLNELWDDFSTTAEKDIRTRLGAFLFTGDEVKKLVATLSGGEKARLLLAKLSMENHNLLILDEPTNHLDIESKEVLERSLMNFEGTILFVSHDRYFINQIATQIIELSSKKATSYLGNYDYYLEKKAENVVENPAAKSKEKAEDNRNITKEKQRQLRKITRTIDSLEEEMESVEQEIKRLQQELLRPEISQSFEQLTTLHQEVDTQEKRHAKLLDEWEEYSLLHEQLIGE
ncbi:MAG: ATP-binding cassette domain-containing protein [Streptococcaceae bacterium]|nr:ATP-binding cassette domain-containing protein [Streptococcaceae bacterium]